jgi:tetratricopeptide (TPR) repeat protein
VLARHLLLALILVGASGINASNAAEKNGDTSKQTVAMSQAVYEGLQAAQTVIEANQFAKGHAELKKLLKISDLSSYETAQIWNLTAYTYYLEENYKKSISAYTRVLKQDDLPEALAQSTLKTLSQLYFTIEDYARALITVERLIQVLPDPSADIYMLKGQAHFQLEQYRKALIPIKTGIDKYAALKKRPRENWLLLLRVCYYELGDFKNMLVILKQLIRLFPKERYVLTLAGVYSELGDTAKQLALTEALFESGKISQPSHIVNLVNLYLVHGLPFKAAKLLDAELGTRRVESNERNLRLLSQAWYQARDDAKALDPLARAAKLSADGELYVRLAQSHINLEHWGQAAEAVNKGLAKGGVKRLDTANLMLGMALFNQRKLSAARAAFTSAVADKRSAKAARQWLAYVDSEMTRETSLEQIVPEQQVREQDAILKNL